MPVANTSGEEVGLPVGASKAMVETQGQVNDPNGTEKDHRVEGLGIHPKQVGYTRK